MKAIRNFILKIAVSLIMVTLTQAYLGFGEARNIVHFSASYAMIFGLLSAGFTYWAIHPVISRWSFDEKKTAKTAKTRKPERRTAVRIKEERVTAPIEAHPVELHPVYAPRPLPSTSSVTLRASHYSNRAITPQQARRDALRHRLSDESVESYERYIPRNKKSEYMYE